MTTTDNKLFLAKLDLRSQREAVDALRQAYGLAAHDVETMGSEPASPGLMAVYAAKKDALTTFRGHLFDAEEALRSTVVTIALAELKTTPYPEIFDATTDALYRMIGGDLAGH